MAASACTRSCSSAAIDLSISLQTCLPKLHASALHSFGRRRFNVLKLVLDAEILPFVAAHLVKRQNVDPFDVTEAGGKFGNLRDVFEIIGEPGHEDEANPDRPSIG